MTLQLCVLLWAVDGYADQMSVYEDRVLALVVEHGGEVLSRVRRLDDGDGPDELQVIELPDEGALEGYLADPARTALAGERRRVVARTETMRVRQSMGAARLRGGDSDVRQGDIDAPRHG